MVAVLLGIALAMDSFAISLAIGTNLKRIDTINKKFLIAFYFGFFQALMYFTGDTIGIFLSNIFLTIIKGISFVLLLLVAINMFREYLEVDKEEEKVKKFNVVYLSFLTSIDALITGIGANTYNLNTVYVSFNIFLVTFLFVVIGTSVAKNLKKIEIIEKNSLLLGSGILLYLALKIII